MVASVEAGKPPPGQAVDRKRRERGAHPMFLFRGAESLGDHPAPRPVRSLAVAVAATGERQLRRGRRGVWLALPIDAEYVLVAEVQHPSHVQRVLDPHGLTLRLGVAFVIIGVVSWLLARSLAAPIGELRRATRRLADGELSVRVGPGLGRRRDETAQLGHDFDRMAGRIGELLDAQGRLLRDVSHELRSPLARLNVALELARRDAGSDAALSLDQIERESSRLDELVGQLLNLTQLESGAGLPDHQLVALHDLVVAVAQDAAFEARAGGRDVAVAVCDEITVSGVPELLHRAVENVVRNAVRFTAEGTAVEISLHRTAGGRVQMVVRDHGPGVPDAVLGELFQPFYRVADARDRQSGGAGLGLAIANRAVAVHGGTLRAENSPGGGLAVILELPG